MKDEQKKNEKAGKEIAEQGFAWQGPNVGEWVGSAVGLAVGDASEQYAPSKPFLHVQEKLSVVSSAESTHVEV